MVQSLATDAFLNVEIEVGAPVEIGSVPGGARRCIPLMGGTVAGQLSGSIVPGGADWQTVRPDGTLEIRARYALRVDQGIIEVESSGLRAGRPEVLRRLAAGETVDAADYYFRTALRFHTAATELAYLNDTLGVAVGERLRNVVRLTMFRIL